MEMQLDLSEKQYLLGIDPSFHTMGICIYEPSTNAMRMFSGDWFSCIEWIGKSVQLKKCVAVLENPDLDSSVFGALGLCKPPIIQFGNYMKKIGAKEWPLPKAVDWNEIASTLSIAFRMASNVGASKASGKLMLEMLTRHKVPTIQIAPSARDRADKTKMPVHLLTMPTKTTQAQFEALTGLKGRSNDDARDACTLVWGKDFKWVAMMLMRGLEDKAAKTRQKSKEKRETKKTEIKDIPKDERKFFNVVGSNSGERVVKENGKWKFADNSESP